MRSADPATRYYTWHDSKYLIKSVSSSPESDTQCLQWILLKLKHNTQCLQMLEKNKIVKFLSQYHERFCEYLKINFHDTWYLILTSEWLVVCDLCYGEPTRDDVITVEDTCGRDDTWLCGHTDSSSSSSYWSSASVTVTMLIWFNDSLFHVTTPLIVTRSQWTELSAMHQTTPPQSHPALQEW